MISSLYLMLYPTHWADISAIEKESTTGLGGHSSTTFLSQNSLASLSKTAILGAAVGLENDLFYFWN